MSRPFTLEGNSIVWSEKETPKLHVFLLKLVPLQIEESYLTWLLWHRAWVQNLGISATSGIHGVFKGMGSLSKLSYIVVACFLMGILLKIY
jgi:hypothetical protein